MERIPAAAAESAFTYLGVRISPWTDVKLEGLREEFGGALFRASRLSLKPHQKVELMSRYLGMVRRLKGLAKPVAN
jgi:hypothetical protein